MFRGSGGSLALALRARLRDPRAVAAALVDPGDGDRVCIEPQRHRALPPRVDAVDDGDRRAATEPCGYLGNDRIDRAAHDRQPALAGDDRDAPAAPAVEAALAGAVEAA